MSWLFWGNNNRDFKMRRWNNCETQVVIFLIIIAIHFLKDVLPRIQRIAVEPLPHAWCPPSPPRVRRSQLLLWWKEREGKSTETATVHTCTSMELYIEALLIDGLQGIDCYTYSCANNIIVQQGVVHKYIHITCTDMDGSPLHSKYRGYVYNRATLQCPALGRGSVDVCVALSKLPGCGFF